MHHHEHEHHEHGPSRRGQRKVFIRDDGESRAAFGGFPGPGWFGPMGPRGRGRGRGPGGRARRGDVRSAVLALLTERPMHGYEIIQELSDRTDGVWRPSPGSVYPTLQLLEDEGLVVAEEDSGKRRYSLTEAGTAAAATLADKKAPWEQVNEGIGPNAVALREEIGQMAAAIVQIARTGTAEQQTEAQAVLAETRRRLYGILAKES